VIGGMTGVLLAIPPADFVLHNSLFLVAHFHNVIIGGVVFGLMAGYTCWFPKAFGFTLDERLGKASFWCWFIGFYLAFMPLYVLGLMGATRRMQHYTDGSWQPLMWVAFAGALVILAGLGFTIAQLVYSIKTRHRRRDTSGDPWNGRTLEWSTPSPPPPWNFTVLPQVSGIDEFWRMKHGGKKTAPSAAPPAIHVPRPSPLGFLTAFCAVMFGFASIWHIWWLAILGLLGAIALLLRHSWNLNTEVQISAEEIAEFEPRREAEPG
jgi:cytochrome o ubiquinol oxidase subunit 1